MTINSQRRAAGLKEHEHAFQRSYRVRGEHAWWQGDGSNATAFAPTELEHAYACRCGQLFDGFGVTSYQPDGTTEDALGHSSDTIRDLLLENQRLRGTLQAPPGRPSGSAPIPADLTPSMLRALKAVATGRTYQEAAGDIGVSYHTLHTQLTHAYYRLGVNSAIGAFVALGWLRVP